MIFVALGSNQGDRAEYLARAQAALVREGVNIIAVSSIMETPALLLPDSPAIWDVPYLNQVLQVQTVLTPINLLNTLKGIEVELGRIDRGRWGPREIDLDLLAYGEMVLQTPELTLPHPQMHARDFVLKPLMEIAPHWQHPLRKQTVAQMMETL